MSPAQDGAHAPRGGGPPRPGRSRPPPLLLAFFGFAAAVLVATLLRIPAGRPLAGAVAADPRPTASVAGVLDGSWQAGMDAWFRQRYPLRNEAIRTYGQLKYSLLGKSANDTLVLVGGSIVEVAYIRASLNLDSVAPDPSLAERIDRYAAGVRAIQDGVEASGKRFLYLLSPSKDILFDGDLPARYALNDNTGVNPNNATLLVAAFQRLGVHFRDARDDVDAILRAGAFRPYSTTGTHWNYYAAAVTAQGLVADLDRIYGIRMPIPEILRVERTSRPAPVDTDVLALLNLWAGRLDAVYYDVAVGCTLPDGYAAPRMMYFGTSCQWELLPALEADGAIAGNDVFQYFNRRDGTGEYIPLASGVRSIEFRALLADNDLFLLESVSSVLPANHEAFVAAWADALSGTVRDNGLDRADGDIAIEASDPAGRTAAPGAVLEIPVRLSNGASNVRLTSSGEHPFSLSYHLLDAAGEEILHDGIRSAVPDVGPSSTADAVLRAVAPAEPGRYTLQLTFVVEGRFWGEELFPSLPVAIPLTVE